MEPPVITLIIISSLLIGVPIVCCLSTYYTVRARGVIEWPAHNVVNPAANPTANPTANPVANPVVSIHPILTLTAI